MDEDIKASLTTKESWIRGLYMLLFAVIYSVAEVVLTAVVVIQFIFLLVSRGPNERLLEFGDDLSVYFYQVIQFLTFNSEEKPFPFGPWPYGEGGPDDARADVEEPVVEEPVVEEPVAEAPPKEEPPAAPPPKKQKAGSTKTRSAKNSDDAPGK